MHLRPLVPVLGLVATTVYGRPSPHPTFQSKCAEFAHTFEIGDYAFTTNVAEYVAANATIDLLAEGLNATCTDSVAPPMPVDVCRLNLRVETSASSEFYMELWLPEKWEGRLLSTGNGGLAGCIDYPDIAYGASLGFATIGTNAGHNGTSGGAFYHQPEVLEDFVWRALYAGTLIGKSLTQQFYNRDSCKSYYIGCSSGGRQGWKAIQQNPELFDGVVAGAPAIAFTNHTALFGNVLKTLGFNPNETLIQMDQWVAMQEEVLKQCDGLDGAVDGILEDPGACTLDWSPLLCSTNASSTCFSTKQADAAKTLFEPLVYNDTELHPGQNHGFEPTLLSYLYTPFVVAWLPEIYRYIIYNDISWDPTTFTLADAAAAIKLNPENINTYDTDISAFRDRGGKVLHWHGAADPLLSIKISDNYYAAVASTLHASSSELDSFYRYFRASGVGHCYSGPGANFMGQLGGYAASTDPDDNMLVRIVKWVEEGEAPEFVRGTKFVNDTLGGEVEFRRRHCKFPAVNHYEGAGNGTDEEGWVCVEPET